MLSKGRIWVDEETGEEIEKDGSWEDLACALERVEDLCNSKARASLRIGWIKQLTKSALERAQEYADM